MTENRRLPHQLLVLLRNYLSNRKITINSKSGTVKRGAYARFPQGSIVGQLLWNIVYDGLLRKLQTIKDLCEVAFADDLALIIATKRHEEINDKL